MTIYKPGSCLFLLETNLVRRDEELFADFGSRRPHSFRTGRNPEDWQGRSRAALGIKQGAVQGICPVSHFAGEAPESG